MTYDANAEAVVLFGGKGARSLYFNDLWTYTPKTDRWRELKPLGPLPPARFGHAIVYDARAGAVLVFAGVVATTDGPSGDLWAYSTNRNAWMHLEPAGDRPAARIYPSAVYDTALKETIVFGGWTGASAFNDTWSYDSLTERWTRASVTDAPRPRWGASMAYDPVTGTIVLFGGLFGGYDGRERLNDTWSYDPATHTWRNLHPAGPLPPARGYAAMDYDATTHEMVLFGGFAGPQGLVSDTWTYDPARNAWSRIAQPAAHPSARDFSALVYDQGARRLLLFGGLSGTQGNINGTLLNDTWSW
jgi:N-acetylneuraminic acid mutarotase